MTTIKQADLIESVAAALQYISYYHPADYIAHLARAYEREQSPAAKDAIAQILTNSKMSATGHRPICQDTGIVNVFLKVGMDVRWEGFTGSLDDAINEGVRQGYNHPDNTLRASVVADPQFDRKNTKDNTPAVIFAEIVPGNTVEVTVAAKGGGSENKSKMVMLNPGDSVVDWILKTVPTMGAGWCPPGMLGIGIGGTAEKAVLMAKESLMDDLDMYELQAKSASGEALTKVEALRLELFEKVNALGIGAQGLGGLTTVLDIKIKMYPTHAASKPVAMIPNCAATRHAHFVMDGSGPVYLTPPSLDTWPDVNWTPDYVKLGNRFHAQVGKADDFGGFDGLADQVGGAADGHQVGALVLFDGFDAFWAALGLADHRDQAGLRQHHFREAVHARGRRRAGGADRFALDRIDRADVINHPVGEINRQFFALEQHVGNALVRCVAAGQHLAVEQQGLAGRPAGDFFLRQRVQIDLLALCVIRCPLHVRPQVQRRRVQVDRAAAVHDEMGVAGSGAVGNHGHRLAGGVGGVHLDLDVQHGAQPTQTLSANSEGVHFLKQFQPQGFGLAECGAGSGFGLQLMHVQVVHQTFLGHQDGLFGRATNTNAQHAGRAPTRPHGGHGLEHPIDHRVTGVEHDHLAFVLAAQLRSQ